MRFNHFAYCTVGRREEIETGMGGKDPCLHWRKLDEIAGHARVSGALAAAGRGSGRRSEVPRARRQPSIRNHTEG